MIPVLSAAQMRQLDEETIEAAKVPGRALMELAADGIVRRHRGTARAASNGACGLGPGG